ncbi:MAG: amino acid ABC transporter permease [Candidatus Tectomicrobia bacterium]|nr:amino acid ABC transporter permease [Candidatus Tectomicrobia bacterium]
MYQWNFGIVWDFRMVYVRGALVTVGLSLYAVVFSMVLGLFIGIARQSKHRVLSLPAAWYVEVLRDTPLLVQIVWIFYCFPILTGLKLSPFWSCVLAISIHMSAYVAEIFRAGIASIDKGQVDAAKVLGMSYAQVMRRIILPQAFRRMLPPLVNNFADILKLTSLASVIGVYELLHSVDNVIMNSFRPLELYTVLAVVYFVLIFPVAFGARRAEVYLARRL